MRICRAVVSMVCALLGASGLVGHTGLAYPTPVDFDGKILRWDITPASPPITWRVEGADEEINQEFEPIIDEAAQLWSTIETSYFRFGKAPEGSVPQVRFILQTAIAGGDYSAGYSTMQKTAAGHPISCEIYVAVDGATAYVPFAKTALHELGHCVGLGHSLVPEAIMSYSLAKNSFALDIDDEAAATRLYPVDSDAPKLPPGCAVGSNSGSLPPRSNLLWLLLTIPMVVAAWPLQNRSRVLVAHRNAPAEMPDDSRTITRVASGPVRR